MTVNSKVLEAMIAAGCSAEQLVAIVRAAEVADAVKSEERREQARRRKQRQRDRENVDKPVPVAPEMEVSRDVTHVTRDMRDIPSPIPVSDKEKSPAPPKEINSTPSPILPLDLPKGRSQAPQSSVRSALGTVLDVDHVDAVIAHRKAIRKPLTPHAAKILARRFALMPDPNAAADAMIGNGWQGFEPEWLDNRGGHRGGRAPPDWPKSAFQQRQDAAMAACDREILGDRDEQQPSHRDADIELGPEDYRAFRDPEATRR